MDTFSLFFEKISRFKKTEMKTLLRRRQPERVVPRTRVQDLEDQVRDLHAQNMILEGRVQQLEAVNYHNEQQRTEALWHRGLYCSVFTSEYCL